MVPAARRCSGRHAGPVERNRPPATATLGTRRRRLAWPRRLAPVEVRHPLDPGGGLPCARAPPPARAGCGTGIIRTVATRTPAARLALTRGTGCVRRLRRAGDAAAGAVGAAQRRRTW